MALDPSYSKAIRYIMQHQNGEAAQQMNHAGIQYNMNYGVSLMQLREFAKETGRNNNLGKQLWNENIRETKLLSLMILDPKEITPQEADKLVSEFTTGELVENGCHHLLSEMPFVTEKILQWITDDETFVKMTGLFLGARYIKQTPDLPQSLFGSLFELIKPETEKNIIYIKKSISLLLLAMAGQSDELKTQVGQFIEELDTENFESCRFIATNVSAELEYV